VTSGLSVLGRRIAPRPRLMLAGLLGGLALACLPAASAHAALISTDACDNATLTQPFAAYGDANQYKLMPGGTFEGSLAGWTLSGGARVVSGGENGGHSLYLPAGGSVTTPLTCVDAAYPTGRYFNKSNGLLSTILVQLIYKGSIIGLAPLPGGLGLLNYSWSPSLPMVTLSAVPGLLDGGTSQLQLRFTSLLGASQIDDVYIDPHMLR
jgi:hypothetical protein